MKLGRQESTAWLVALDGPLGNARFSLDAPCLVGRGPLNHIVLDDPRVSRQHAKISIEAGEHFVYDLNSANGTFINDSSVRRERLSPNDVVRFGPFRFRFQSDSQSGSIRQSGPKVREVRTIHGIESVGTIVGSVDAASFANPPSYSGLGELEDADRKLSTLHSFLHSISMTVDMGDLLERTATSLLGIFPAAETAVIYLRDAVSGEMTPRKVASVGDRGLSAASSLSTEVKHAVVEQGRAILSAPVGALGGRGLTMHAPMIYRDLTQGVLVLGASPKHGAPFGQRDLDLLSAASAHAALALQNLRMHGELLKQQRLQRELALAEQIQKSFLPRQLPQVPGIDFFAEYQPAYQVGGDFYDVFWLSEGRLGLFIGDVAGKGVPAALLMARITSDLRMAAFAEQSPSQVLARVNQAMVEREQHDMFFTGIYLTLDVRSGSAQLSNGGHLAPLLIGKHGTRLDPIEGGEGTAVGLFENESFGQVEFRIQPGDALVLYTDGVIDATNLEGEQFGSARFEASLALPIHRTEELTQRVLQSLRVHVGEAPQSDDLTLLVCGLAG